MYEMKKCNEVEVEAECANVVSYETENMIGNMDERKLVTGTTIIATEHVHEINEPKEEQMSEEDIEMIRWLKSASTKELRKAMRDVEKKYSEMDVFDYVN